MINTSLNTQVTTQLDTRRSERTAQIENATLDTAQALSSPQIQAHNSCYNQVVDSTTQLQTGGIGGVTKAALDGCFELPSANHRIEEATEPNPRDNDKAEDVREKYRDDAKEVQRDRTEAERLAKQPGEGTHTLVDKDGNKYTITVTKDAKTGETTVQTQKPDGSTKTVRYDPKNPSKTSVQQTSPDGTTRTLTQDGTKIKDHRIDKDGKITSDDFDIDDKGRPVQEHRDSDGHHTIVTANPDGSSDTKTEVGEIDGTTLYEPTHDDPHPHARPCESDPYRYLATRTYPWDRAFAARAN